MRIRTLVLVGLSAFGLSTAGFAEPAAERHVVGQALSSTQAVLLDEESGEYRIVRIGDELNGARVVAIGAEDVVLVHGGTKEMLKLAPDPRPRPKVVMEPLVINIKPVAAPVPAPAVAAAPAPVVAAPVVAAVPAAAAVPPPVAVAAPVAVLTPPAAAPVAVAAPAPVAVAAPAPIAVAPAPVAVAAPAPVAVAAPAPVAAAPAPAPVAVAAPAPAPAQTAPAVIQAPPIVVAAPPHGSPPITLTTPPNSTVVVQPPVQPAAPAVQPVPAPPPAAPAAPVSTPAPIAAPAPAPVQAAAPALVAPPAIVHIAKADLDRGLGDFAALDASVAIELAPQGGFRVADLKSGSFLNRMGLRQGDVLLRVDGRPLRSAEDASAAYKWVRVADRFTVDLIREGRPVTLRFAVSS